MQDVYHVFIITKLFLCMKKMGETEKWQQLHQGGGIVVQLFLLKII